MVHRWPSFLICALIVRESSEDHIFQGLKERKERQHFLSQNNLSLCLTRLPAIFTQLKLQMIYFQLHYSPALWHMLLSITPVATEPSARERTQQKKTERKKRREEGQWGAEKPNSYFLRWLAFVVRGSSDTQQSEWNYWAFIKQTAGPRQNLKAAAKQPTRKTSYQNTALCFCMRDTDTDMY